MSVPPFHSHTFCLSPLSVSNYGPTIAVQNEAIKQGCQQVLWLYGEQEEITEVGTMNLFIYWTNEGGGLFHCLSSVRRLQNVFTTLDFFQMLLQPEFKMD